MVQNTVVQNTPYQNMIDRDSVYIVMPAKDEAPRVGQVITGVLANGYKNVIVVNDGSMDTTEQVSTDLGATVLNHPINLGPGAATQTGISYALQMGAKVIVTIDSDDQHKSSDIDKLVGALLAQDADIVIGSRFLKTTNQIPKQRIFYNKVGNFITYMLTGLKVSDSQSGMKAFKSDFAEKWELYCNGFEFCMEIIWNAQRYDANLQEVPIHVTYTEETMAKGQNILSGFRMLGRLARSFYFSSSR